MLADDYDWAQEVDDALEQKEHEQYTADLIEAHMRLRIWLNSSPVKEIKA